MARVGDGAWSNSHIFASNVVVERASRILGTLRGSARDPPWKSCPNSTRVQSGRQIAEQFYVPGKNLWWLVKLCPEPGLLKMCGIVGRVGRKSTLGAMEPEPGIAALFHRGPDAAGEYAAGRVTLGHTRLSIIDLAGGSQPMATSDGKLRITFNGEIFNFIELREELEQKGHEFQTRSDTEVILHLYEEYGPDCTARMNGQWAFALWDDPRQRLFLSRDRMGVRPLYYASAGNDFIFGSEIKAIFAHDRVKRELDLETLDQIFTFWCPLPSRTIFKGVRQIPPGHSAILENGELRIWRYWDTRYVWDGDVSRESEDSAAEGLLELLLDATRLRLRADVPVGVYLSGGLDSAVTTALVKRVAQADLRAFSVAFADRELDESEFQQEAAAFIGARRSTVHCINEEIAEVFPDVVWHMEQPVLRTAPAPLYLLSKLVRNSGFKVVLTGEGADEILGGYDIYKEAKVRRFIAREPRSLMRPLLLKRLYPYMSSLQKQTPEYLRRSFHVDSADLGSPFFSHLPRWEMTGHLKTFFSEDVRGQLAGYDCLDELRSELPDDFSRWNPFCQAQYLETKILLPGYILSAQGDRVAMAHSVEARYPFLDHRVVDFAARLPPRLKMKALDEKHILKRAVRDLVPDSILKRPKQPYRAPDGKSFVNSKARDYVERLLCPGSLREAGIFKPEPVQVLLQKFRSNRLTNVRDNMALVAVLSTSLVVDQFIHNFRGQAELCNSLSESSVTLS